MALVILRCVFAMMAITLGFQLLQTDALASDQSWLPWLGFLGVLLIASGVLFSDMFIRKKHLGTITAFYFGLIIGLFLTYVLKIALTPIWPTEPEWLADWLLLAMASVVCYSCVSVLLQTQDDFRFLIPYVEFIKEIKGLKPYILDTSVVIDGRIADVVETRIIDNQLIMPQFVIAELQVIADSSDRLRRSRGRRGLDILNRLRSDPKVDMQVFDRELPEFAGQPVDQKLVLLAKHLEGKVVTNDYNLNKVAKLHDVGVINLNDLSNALKPIFLPGETLEVRIIKMGEEAGQGVGYLEDGTMVVIEGGRDYVNQTIVADVTSVLQTSAGRMVFGKYETDASGKNSRS